MQRQADTSDILTLYKLENRVVTEVVMTLNLLKDAVRALNY